MQRRHIVSIGALVVLTLTAGCVGALGTQDTGSSAPAANQTVTVSATGEVTAEADQAVVRVSVVARGDTAEAARERLAENVSAMRSAVSDAGVSDDRIETSGYDIGEERYRPSEKPGEHEDVQYVARQSFEITLSDTDRAGEIVDVAVGNGATHVEGVQFTLSQSAQAEVKQEALRAAMADARRNAETLAETENLSIDQALRITNTEVRPMPYAAEMSVSADSGAGTTIDGGPVRVTATVEVVYAAN